MTTLQQLWTDRRLYADLANVYHKSAMNLSLFSSRMLAKLQLWLLQLLILRIFQATNIGLIHLEPFLKCAYMLPKY